MLECFEDLLGKTLMVCENLNDEELVFTLTTGEKYKLYHRQVCCENVSIEDIVGDLNDLVGSPILMAEKVTNDESEASEELPDYGKVCFL